MNITVLAAAGRVAAVTLLVVAASLPQAAHAAPPTCANGYVALTFDDGPSPTLTPLILDALRRHDAVATFFPIGSRVVYRPDLMRRAWAEGHALANHTWDHPWLTSLSDDAIRTSLRRAAAALRDAGVEPLKLYRPPFGATSARVRAAAASIDFTEILWTVDPQDYRNSAAYVRDHVLARLRNGAVILFHDGTARSTTLALDDILKGVHARGFCTALLTDTGAVVPPPVGDRLSGTNRFATAASIAAHAHPHGSEIVFIATGTNFPDALSAAAAAGFTGSPLLLTGSLPKPTATALDALHPSDIVLVGGTTAISDADATALGAWGQVTRLAGVDRYATAIAVSQWLFTQDGSADTVIIATGENFPDALTAASLAARLGGPVLLTPHQTLPDAVATEILRLAPSKIYITGGTSVISESVANQLALIAPITRIAGSNRYATAVAISQTAFPDGSDVVYIASGIDFPDALAGAAAAAALGAPVLLTPPAGLPTVVADEIRRLDPHTVYILGGPAVVPRGVEYQVVRLVP